MVLERPLAPSLTIEYPTAIIRTRCFSRYLGDGYPKGRLPTCDKRELHGNEMNDDLTESGK
jgi:hypothetical protein